MASKDEPDKRLVNLAFRIKPVVMDKAGELHFIRPVDICRDKLDGKKAKPVCHAEDLKEIGTVRMEIPAGLREFYGPTVAQALSQLPKELRRRATAFHIEINSGMYSGEDMSVPATATIYMGKLPEAVGKQPVIALGKTFTPPPARQAKETFNAAAETQSEIRLMKPIVFKKPDNAKPSPG